MISRFATSTGMAAACGPEAARVVATSCNGSDE
jgi:hypothetical protein